ncbi:BMP family ABC transporter substrate-binding protein [Actinoalloteichus sp. AHMU CJ021]|uniref:Basic membrane protein A n=1 Tax=Actinoalloteichus caeruleus DSM 43889 TaxID=1120930 RepID=A0ABT1JDC7_ACTCY|nr:BMP family ABC transporter substrate-binding protein [Actinoalloteichus caeruleus]AUS82021.1 BMP family ABC transporter substrate-binding protein [Actinoalloteichus sp. AHMU CJ021]MCP2330502.1 basic membrane protein A [Actinoalloteichus caeruleus DSM 43889]
MSRPLRLATLAVVTSLTAVGCNAASTDSAGSSEDGPSFVLVTPNPVGVNDFLTLSVRGVEEAADQHRGSHRTFESTDPASLQHNVAAAVRDQPDVVVAVGFNFADVLAQEAERNPDQQFLFVDSCTEDPFPNVTCATFREHEAAYLAGAQAGLLTQTDRVGAVVVLDSPQFHRFSLPFADGAARTNPDVEFTQLFIGGQNPFNDPARAKELAATLAGSGVDHVMGAASAAGNLGVFEAAADHGIHAFGVDSNQCPASPGQVVDNVVKRTDVVIADGIEAILAGDTGGNRSYGLAEEGVSLNGLLDDVDESGCVIAEHPEVVEQVRQLHDEIVAGDTVVTDPAA